MVINYRLAFPVLKNGYLWAPCSVHVIHRRFAGRLCVLCLGSRWPCPWRWNPSSGWWWSSSSSSSSSSSAAGCCPRETSLVTSSPSCCSSTSAWLQTSSSVSAHPTICPSYRGHCTFSISTDTQLMYNKFESSDSNIVSCVVKTSNYIYFSINLHFFQIVCHQHCSEEYCFSFHQKKILSEAIWLLNVLYLKHLWGHEY